MPKRHLLLALLALGCGDDARVSLRAADASAADASARCARAEDCDDGDRCTVDLCVVGNVCEHERQSGCVSPRRCTRATDCDDGIACTRDRCLVSGVCDSVSDDPLCLVDAGAPTVDVPVATDAVAASDVPLAQADVFTPTDVVIPPADVPLPADAGSDPRSGTYAVAPSITYACQDEVFETPIVRVSLASIQLTITAAGASATWPGAPATLTGPAPAPDALRLTATVPHKDCNTVITLTANFSDARRFSATIALSFNGIGCALTSCEARSFPFNGTRTP